MQTLPKELLDARNLRSKITGRKDRKWGETESEGRVHRWETEKEQGVAENLRKTEKKGSRKLKAAG